MRARLLPALTLAATVAVLGLPAASASSPHAAHRRAIPASPLRRDTRPYRPTGRLEVKFKSGVGAARRQQAYDRVSARGLGVHVVKTIPGLNAALLSVSSARRVQAALLADSAVEFVEPESRYEAMVDEPVTNELHEIQADTVHTQNTPNLGAGSEIAVLDSIVDATNPDLDGVGKVSVDWNLSTSIPDDPNDPYHTHDEGACTASTCPHGTAVAAVAAGEGGDGGMAGVAPAAKIRSYNVFRYFSYDNPDPSGPARVYTVSASSTDIAAALDYIRLHIGTTPNLYAVNMSLGGRFDNTLISDAITNLHAAAPQLAIAVAAGNDGGERANFPAGDPYVISVGAIGQTPVFDGSGNYVACPASPPSQDAQWLLADFSNRGAVDVVAPGRCVTSWYPPENDAGQVSGPAVVTQVDGTSFAAPMVAGELALLGTAGITGDKAKAAVIAGADHTLRSVVSGAGPAKAMDAINLATGSAAYTALRVVRGAQLATVVGRRTIEAIRVEPQNSTTTTAAPVLAVSSGFGSVTPTTTNTGIGLTTVLASYVPSPTASALQTFNLAANTNLSLTNPDHPVVPMWLLDVGDSFEGQPAANNESASVNLTYGSRSAYVRSAAIPNGGVLSWTYDYNDFSTLGATVWIWTPTVAGGVADAGSEPFAYENDPDAGQHTDAFQAGVDCSNCYGRTLIGWLTSSPADDSDPADPTTRYLLRLNYTGPTATLSTPVYASNVSTTGQFKVNWGGTNVATWDVYWSSKTKLSNGTYAITSWHPWKIGTSLPGVTFGAANLPTKVLQGVTYWFKVLSHDAYGNPSMSVVGTTSAPFDDRYSGMAYGGSWTSVSASGRWLSTERKSGTAGASVALRSDTSRFTVVGDRCAVCGQVKVYVDGVYKATVDTYASSTRVRQVLWTSAVFAGGPKSHKVQLVLVGTAHRPYFYLDGIAIYR